MAPSTRSSKLLEIVLSAPQELREILSEAIVHADPDKDGSLNAEIEARGGGEAFRELNERIDFETRRRTGRSRFVAGWRG